MNILPGGQILSPQIFSTHTLLHPEILQPTPLRVHRFEPQNRNAQASRPHRHDFYQIIYVTEGSGQQIIDGEPYSIVPETLYLLSPEQVHCWQLKESLQGQGVLFTPELLPSETQISTSFWHTLTESPELRPTHTELHTIHTLLELLQAEYTGCAFGYESACTSYLHLLLIHIQRLKIRQAAHSIEAMPSPMPLNANRFASQFKTLVLEHYGKHHSVQYYADRLGVTKGHLADVIRATTGQTPGQIIRQALIQESKRLLLNTDQTIAQISYALAFDDPAYFGRFFRREVGLSPGEFRNTFRKKYQLIRS